MAAKTKIINHHKYTLGKCFSSKRDAVGEARSWRQEGHLARVVKSGDKYCVYYCWYVRW